MLTCTLLSSTIASFRRLTTSFSNLEAFARMVSAVLEVSFVAESEDFHGRTRAPGITERFTYTDDLHDNSVRKKDCPQSYAFHKAVILRQSER